MYEWYYAIILWAAMAAGNFFYQALTKENYLHAAELGFYQLTAILFIWFMIIRPLGRELVLLREEKSSDNKHSKW